MYVNYFNKVVDFVNQVAYRSRLCACLIFVCIPFEISML